jgi:hypothetical protein
MDNSPLIACEKVNKSADRQIAHTRSSDVDEISPLYLIACELAEREGFEP